MTEQLNLNPLHDLTQVIHLTDRPDLDPLVALAQLRRKPSPRGKDKEGDIEWLVCLGGGGTDAGDWWSTALSSDQVRELVDVKGSALRGDTLIERIRVAWKDGDLGVKGFEVGKRGPFELIVNITSSLSVPIKLQPCASFPLPLVSVLAKLIPGALLSVSSAASASNATSRLEKLKRDYDKLYKDKEFYKEKATKKGKVGGRGASTQGGSASQGDGGSPKKAEPGVPGVTQRAQLQAGQKGFAGNSRRAGLVAPAADDFDPASDSD